MKKVIRAWFITILALKIIAEATGAIHFQQGIKTLLLAGLAFVVFEFLLKPVLKLLLLPINLLTLGLLRWVINVAGFYLVSVFIPGFSISAYYFPGINRHGLIIAPAQLSLFATFILLSFLFNLAVSTINWILKK